MVNWGVMWLKYIVHWGCIHSRENISKQVMISVHYCKENSWTAIVHDDWKNLVRNKFFGDLVKGSGSNVNIRVAELNVFAVNQLLTVPSVNHSLHHTCNSHSKVWFSANSWARRGLFFTIPGIKNIHVATLQVECKMEGWLQKLRKLQNLLALSTQIGKLSHTLACY